MTSRELVKRALNFEECDRIPTERDDVTGPIYTLGSGRKSGVPENTKGVRTDEWGVEWIAYEDGVCGEVKHPPLESWDDLDSFTPPYDVLEEADLSKVNECCRQTDRFVMPFWWANYNLFERMQELRGPENLFMDIAMDEPELYILRDKVHAYFMKQAEMWVQTDVDGLHIADDWGTQTSLLINPEHFRKIFKPCYKEYCDLAHKHGKYVIMHSDGYTKSILGDLAEIGVNAINTQIFCMDMDELAAEFHHKIAFWGEIDRQHILPHGTTDDCRAAVRRVADAFLKYGRTGIVGQAFWGKDIPAENLDAVYDEWKRV
ncbi:MAG TPA: methyltransferase [Firmicutes bacterium]|nr:methyltransferase [Bacillota bacterium]